ncbi:MAG TPA: FUSC family protein [Gaiellales bacterium]|nr:FUSC family protein [Gaiellales bacterium]
MPDTIRFTRADVLHAAVGILPAVPPVALGYLTPGVAFMIGLLPTSLMGIAPTHRLRIIYGLVGCLFGVGILVGAAINSTHEAGVSAAMFFVICVGATMFAATRPAGAVLLGILVPSLGVGTGYEVSRAAALMVAFMAGSIWSCLVTLPIHEFPPDPGAMERLRCMQPRHTVTYGVLLGLTAATAILTGAIFDIPYAGWIATAALLVIRPVQEMTGWRGVGRAISTIAGTLLVMFTLHLDLGYPATAAACAAVAIVTIGARTSTLYITSFGTAFLILTIELHQVSSSADVHQVGRYRIGNNVLGAAIALFFGLLISWLLERLYFARRFA